MSTIPLEVLCYQKAKENKQVRLFISTNNRNYPNLFPLKRKTVESLQHNTTIKDVF